MSAEIVLVGIGNGDQEITLQAIEEIRTADVILGFEGFINQTRKYFKKDVFIVNDKELRQLSGTDAKLMVQRAIVSIKEASQGKKVVMISGGDMGIYTPSLYIIAKAKESGVENIRCVPGIGFLLSTAAKVGVPLINGFALTSLWDNRSPEDFVLKRIEGAAIGDYVLVIYEPVSEATIIPEMYPEEMYPEQYPIEEKCRARFLKVCQILKKYLPGETPVAITKYHTTNALREALKDYKAFSQMAENHSIVELSKLEQEFSNLDYLSTIIVGNRNTVNLGDILITKYNDGLVAL